MNRVTRAEKILNKLAETHAITECGKDWLIAAVDPFHDTQLKNLEGWPDVEETPSVVRCIKQTMTVSSTGSGNWDLHIVAWPWLNKQPFNKTSARHGNVLLGADAVGHDGEFGGVQAFAVASGVDLDISDPSTYTLLGTMDLNPDYTQGVSRLVGMGVESVNTTSDLYRQGQVTVYRMPDTKAEPCVFTRLVANPGPPTDATGGTFSAQIYRPPPKNQQVAMLISGSRQWKASDGTYQVVPNVGQDNPPFSANYHQPFIAIDGSDEDAVYSSLAVAANVGQLMYPMTDVWLPGTDVLYPARGQHLFPNHQVGCIYTGLSPQTTISISTNMYVESFPGPAEPGILVLATPSATYDYTALQLYSRCLAELPVGVPADWNGFGDWFVDAIGSLAQFIEPVADVASMFGVPGASLISKAAKYSGKAANGYLAAQSPQVQSQSMSLAAKQVKKVKKEKRKQKKLNRQATGHK